MCVSNEELTSYQEKPSNSKNETAGAVLYSRLSEMSFKRFTIDYNALQSLHDRLDVVYRVGFYMSSSQIKHNLELQF